MRARNDAGEGGAADASAVQDASIPAASFGGTSCPCQCTEQGERPALCVPCGCMSNELTLAPGESHAYAWQGDTWAQDGCDVHEFSVRPNAPLDRGASWSSAGLMRAASERQRVGAGDITWHVSEW